MDPNLEEELTIDEPLDLDDDIFDDVDESLEDMETPKTEDTIKTLREATHTEVVKGTTVLMISLDRTIFNPGSEARKRMTDYGALFEQLYIVVFAHKRHKLEPVQLAPNVWVYPTDSWTKPDYIIDTFRIVRNQLVVQGKLVADVISAQGVEAGFAGWLLSRKYRRVLQLQLHGDFFSPYFKKAARFNWLRLRLMYFLLSRTHCVRVVSEGSREKIEKKYPHLQGKVDVLPIHVSIDHFQDAQPQFDIHERYPEFAFTILMVSRLTEEKNIFFAIEVFAEVLKHYPRAGLVIVGEGPLRKKILQHARTLGVAGQVVLEGQQDDVISYYKTSNLFLHTSRYEGYGMALIEAAACGMPIVTSNVGIASTLQSKTEGAFVCPVDDKACFVNEIVSFLSDNSRRMLFKFNIREELKSLTAGSYDAYLEAYQKGVEQCLSKDTR